MSQCFLGMTFLLATPFLLGFTDALPSSEKVSASSCCQAKTVGDYNYTLISNGPVHDRCISECIYSRDGDPGGKYCFARGNLAVNCWSNNNTSLPPITNLLEFEEGGQKFSQIDSFHEETGVLKSTVPAHGNYTESTLVFHEDAGSLVKNSGTCHITDDHITADNLKRRVSQLYKRRTVDSEEKKFHLNLRQEKVGHARRKTLHNAHSSHCTNEPIVLSKRIQIPKEDFDKMNAGEVIILSEKNRKVPPGRNLSAVTCATFGHGENPKYCYRFRNPQTNDEIAVDGIHDIVNGGVCTQCCIFDSNVLPCKKLDGSTACPCAKIKDTHSLIACSCKNITGGNLTNQCTLNNNVRSGQGGDHNKVITTQTTILHTQGNDPLRNRTYAIEVKMPAHRWNGRSLEKITVIINSNNNADSKLNHDWHIKNNMMMKIGENCEVTDISEEASCSSCGWTGPAGGGCYCPIKWIMRLREIKSTSGPEDDENRYFINIPSYKQIDKDSLHDRVQEECPNGVRSIIQKEISKEDHETLDLGGALFLDEPNTGVSCRLTNATVKNAGLPGSWRQPTQTTHLYHHNIITSVKQEVCCESIVSDDGCCERTHPNVDMCELLGSHRLTITIGRSPYSNSKTVTVPAGYFCPSHVSKANWVGTETWPDIFETTQSGTNLTVKRLDDNGGWGQNLRIICSKGNAFIKMNDGELCSSSRFRIRSEFDCRRASIQLGLQFDYAWEGPGDFPGCLHANDGRNKVYFNTSPNPSTTANNKKYAAICTGF